MGLHCADIHDKSDIGLFDLSLFVRDITSLVVIVFFSVGALRCVHFHMTGNGVCGEHLCAAYFDYAYRFTCPKYNSYQGIALS